MFLAKSKAYYEENRSSYWRDSLSKEKDGERDLFEGKGVNWLVPFAPLRGLNEVQAVVKGKSNLGELGSCEWSGLAEGLAKILRFFGSQGY